MRKPLRVLILEDCQADADLMLIALRAADFDPQWTRVMTQADYLAKLTPEWEVILADYNLPQFDAIQALRLLQERKLDIPFIIVSGAMGEEQAVAAMKDGAADYLLKDRLTRLGQAVSHSLAQQHLRAEMQKAQAALRASAADLAHAQAIAHLGNWRWDLASGEMEWSAEMFRIHGVDPNTFDCRAESIARLVHPDDRGRCESVVAAALANQQVEPFRVRINRPDGSLRVLKVILAELHRNEDGTGTYLFGVTHDITHEAALEERLRQTQKMEAVGRLAAGVAHDFNNILTAILGYNVLLERQVRDQPKLFQYSEEIRLAAERARALTRQLLLFSRKQVEQAEILGLNAAVAGLKPMLQRIIGEDIRLETHLPTSSCAVRADPGQIEQVILNLVVNARDAMATGGTLTIEIADAVQLDEAAAQELVGVAPGPYVKLSVRDTGIGMTPEVQAHLFEPFFTTKPVGHGTGIGLPTVYGIVKHSGGHITVESEPGMGSTFVVYLPRAQDPTASKTPVSESSIEPGGEETVLLLEDNATVRALTSEMLATAGYRVLEAADCADALQMAQQNSPIHLLVTDMVLPDVNGIVSAKRLRSIHPKMKVIYMSGYSEASFTGQDLGPNDAFIQKPFDLEPFLHKIREVLDSPARES